MGVRRLRLGLAVATCALITMCGCTTSDGTKPSELPSVSNSGSASTSATPKLTAEQEAIVSQYKAYFEKFVQLIDANDLEIFDALTKYAYPAVVDVAKQGLQHLRDQGKMPGGHIEFGILNPVVTEGSATLSECRDGSTELLLSVSDGSVLSHGSPGALFESKLNRDPDGQWRITEVNGTEGAC